MLAMKTFIVKASEKKECLHKHKLSLEGEIEIS